VARGLRPIGIYRKSKKTSVSVKPETKFKLATLKAELRRQGLRASESDVIEALIDEADASKAARLLKSR